MKSCPSSGVKKVLVVAPIHSAGSGVESAVPRVRLRSEAENGCVEDGCSCCCRCCRCCCCCEAEAESVVDLRCLFFLFPMVSSRRFNASSMIESMPKTSTKENKVNTNW